MPFRYSKLTQPAFVVVCCLIAFFTAVSTAHQYCTMCGLAERQSETMLCKSSSESPIVECFGKDWPFDCVVIDELSSFKNHQSQRWKALKKVRHRIKRMIGLTGTPASNGLMDLWAEVGIIDGGERLGRFIGRYREAFFRAAGMNPYTGVVYNYTLRPGAEEKIYERISDITVSMKASDYLDVPEMVTVRHEVEMSDKERKAYRKTHRYS